MRPAYYFAYLSLLFQFVASVCNGQYYFKRYQVDDGLAHNAVVTILQDSKGFMWFGTRGGLNRFDGYNFKVYRNPHNKFGSIGNNVITALAEDKAGMLWIATGTGIFMYNPFSEAVSPLEIAPASYISHLVIDQENNVWFLANYSLYKYDQRQKKIENLHIGASCLAIDRKMNIWMGDNDGVVSTYHPGNRSLFNIRVIGKDIPGNMRSISKIYPLSGGEVLVGCFKLGLKSYNVKTGAIKSLPLRNSENTEIYVRDITAGSDREYWIATESGIFVYDMVTGKCRNLRKRTGDPYSLGDNAVYAICRDNQGSMWAGTYFGGVNYYSRENARFEKYYPVKGINSISGEAVRAICPDNNGNLWIGTEDAGVNKLDPRTGQFTVYSATGRPGDISYHNIHGLLALDNQLFIGPFFHGMDIMDMRTGKVTDHFKFIGDKSDNVSDFIHHFYLTRDSTLLVGTAYQGSGLFAYNRTRKVFSRITQIPYNSYVFNILEDSKGNIWTSSSSRGAFYYNPGNGRSGNMRFGDKVKGKTVNEASVQYIFEDSSHAMWFATAGEGLIRLSPDWKTMKKFSTVNGLPSNVLFCIQEDNSKRLWISSLKGLICFDLRTGKCKTYTQSNGLLTDQFNYSSAYKDPSGKMYFGSVKGMIAFDPAEFDQKDSSPPTYITGFQLNNKELVPGMKDSPLNRSILYTDTLVLAHDQNNFSIEFAALNYSSTRVTRYKYIMQGVEKYWTYLNTNRNAYFTDLSPGEYTFMVRAESNVGSWSGRERRFFIRILPPFWQTYTAYIVYLVLLGTCIYVSIRYYHRQLERKNLNRLQLFEYEKRKEIYEAKIEFFTNITHEIQTPLTLIVGPAQRLLKKSEELPGIRSSLQMLYKNAIRLTELTSQLLDFRRTEMNQFGLNFVNVDIANLLKEQIAVFDQEAKKDLISLNLELPESRVVCFVDREAFVKICSNLLSNAVKYADTTVTVSLMPPTDRNEVFSIRFRNDGKGIPGEFKDRIFEPFFRLRGSEKAGTGLGLSLAQSLTQLHKGSLTLISGDPDRIIFELTLPVRQEVEFNLGSWKKRL
ncbi:ligand-binding sensor domain-containing protein [Hufsiella ginkgonis]|uniref:histidine kinase n=1 Tax=Hufsiella ginkgonis TaxID=2695274 RepID=A0A7K1XSC7_9SPHI|nr:sensor histidine kinase [Hufsiella ginkgonis]MXV13800.1 histidine kinase [Hufsiella ginkgonis]